MPADLRVSAIAFPVPLEAPCPTTLVVTVTNDGDEPPIYRGPRVFDVAVDISGSADSPFAPRFFAKVIDAERSKLQPGASTDVTVDVQFPCLTTAWVRADAVSSRTIQNDLHSQPPFSAVASPRLVPAVVVSVEAGQDGSQGPRFQDSVVCPDRDLFVAATMTNRGCAPAPATTLDLSLEDPKGRVFGNRSVGFGALAPGASTTTFWHVQTPKLADVPGRMLVVRASGDPNKLILDQCDRATLSATVAKTVDAGTPPRLAIFLSRSTIPPTLIFPGQLPYLGWQFQNGCQDVGNFTWRLLYGTPPTTLAQGAGTVFPREAASHVIDPQDITIPPAIASSFWRIGTQTLTVELLGTGADKGPYRATFDLVISPETVDASWWTWTGLFAATWNVTYGRTGFLRNKGLGPMTLTALDFLEHPNNAPDQTTDATVNADPSMLPVPIATGRTAAFTFGFFHTWTWMTRAFFVRTGPDQVDYDYTAHFTLTDAFGNVYGPIASSSFTTHVLVPPAKVRAQEQATYLTTVGTAIVAGGIICFLMVGYPYNAICLIPLAAGMAMVIAGTLRGEDALDPPIPDFGPHRDDAKPPAEWQLPAADGDPAVEAFRALALDLRRIDAAARDAARARNRAFAAHVDDDRDQLAQRQRECREALTRLERGVQALAPIVDEVHSRASSGRAAHWLNVPKNAKLLAGKELAAQLREAAKELEVSKDDLQRVEQLLETTTEEQVHAAVASLRSDGLRKLPPVTLRWYEALRDEYSALPFLH